MKNRAIEFYRFVFAIVICMHHIRGTVTSSGRFSNFFGAGYLAVDLFFMVSGYLLAAHYDNHREEDAALEPGGAAIRYAADRWKRLFAFHTYAWLFAGAVQIYVWKSITWKSAFSDGFFEFFMLESLGMGSNGRVNGPGWYCSALIICSFLIYYLLSKDKKSYLHFVVPVSCALIFSYFFNKYGHLNRWTQNPLLVCDGLFRGFAEMGIGCICYDAVSKIKRGGVHVTKHEGLLWGTGEIILFCLILFTMWMPSGYKIGQDVPLEFICIPLMAAFIIIVFSEKSCVFKLMDNAVCGYLGKISLHIYLNHIVIERSISKYFGDRNIYKVLLLYIAVVLSYSALTLFVFERVKIKRKVPDWR